VIAIFGLEAHWNVSATEHRIISIMRYAEASYHTDHLTPESFYSICAETHFITLV
jgi:hypothetical protein